MFYHHYPWEESAWINNLYLPQQVKELLETNVLSILLNAEHINIIKSVMELLNL